MRAQSEDSPDERQRRVRVDSLSQIKERSVQNILHERVCLAIASIDGETLTLNFQIVADSGTASYRITPLPD